MDLRKQVKPLVLYLAVFIGLFWLPMQSERFVGAIGEALHLARWYAREHVLLCLVPAFFIAGAIGVFISQTSVIKFLGPTAPRALAYGVASVSGSVLAAGFLLGRPGHEGVIPARYVQMLVGETPEVMLQTTGWDDTALAGPIRSAWPVWTNLFASVFGALMYFATLTEVPILQGLIGAGMGKGPALALLLAGPALPNMLVIAGVLGREKR